MSELISVIIAVYNAEKYIKETIESVLRQTYQNFEIIIINDCSTDNSEDIIRNFDDNRIKYIRNEYNLGLAKNIKKAVEIVRGGVVVLLGHDDMFVNTKFEKQLNYMIGNDLEVCYSRNYVYYSTDNIVESNLDNFAKKVATNDKSLMDDIYIPNYDVILPMSQSAMFKTYVLKQLNYLRDTVRLDDWPILIKCFEQYKCGFYNEPTFYWRHHTQNMHKNIWYNMLISFEAIVSVVPIEKRLHSFSSILNFLGDQVDADNITKLQIYLSSFVLNPTKEKWKKIKKHSKKQIKKYLCNIFKRNRK